MALDVADDAGARADDAQAPEAVAVSRHDGLPVVLEALGGEFARPFIRKEQKPARVGRLAEVLFILIIRSYLERADVEEGFLLALKDERISNSLKAMHEQPAKDWTLQKLAGVAGMSRSLYSKEFKKLAGETPLSYLTNWRILKAKELLPDNKKNISEVASDVGYQSEAAFNRLFKSKTGETPAGYRRKLVS